MKMKKQVSNQQLISPNLYDLKFYFLEFYPYFYWILYATFKPFQINVSGHLDALRIRQEPYRRVALNPWNSQDPAPYLSKKPSF